MEVLHLFGTDEQQQRWLDPLLDGEIRSCFAMTEPDVASSDARNIATSIPRDGDDYVINGRKWWTTGAADPRCAVLIVMGRTDPDAEPHRQQSMVLVPDGHARRRPGPRRCRCSATTTSTGTARSSFDGRAGAGGNLLGEEGDGFAIAQAAAGPGPRAPLHARDRHGRAGAAS